MSEQARGQNKDDLPEKVRQIIRREIDSGLWHFRKTNFEARLESLPKPALKGKKHMFGLGRPRWALMPALSAAVAGIIILAAVLWFGRAKPSSTTAKGSLTIDAALSGLPGFRTLSMSPQTEPVINEVPMPAVAAVLQALASAGRSAAPGKETAVPAAGKLVPRYSLEEKMKILFDDKIIERALSIFKDKFKEV